ncbi:MAG: hypothetical protein QXZ40_03710, partial [Candidatus Micrarchaeia archaeon]
VIILLLALALYFLMGGMKAGVVNPFQQQQQPQEQKWELSPLVAKYVRANTTPLLVVNCRYAFEGSDALGEQRGSYPAGTDRENIGRALCFATNDSAFCNEFKGFPKFFKGVLNFTDCKEGNRSVIYAFHNPLCPICAAQREVLDEFRIEFYEKLRVKYICVPTSQRGYEECARQYSIGRYDG